MRQKIIFILLVCLVLTSCVKIVFQEFIYLYKVETQSSRVVVSFRNLYGNITIDTIRKAPSNSFGLWLYGFEGKSEKERYFINVKNDTSYGYIKVSVFLNDKLLKDTIGLQNITLKN